MEQAMGGVLRKPVSGLELSYPDSGNSPGVNPVVLNEKHVFEVIVSGHS